MTGDLPSGWTARKAGGASIVCGIARVKPDLVGNVDFLEQPENPMGTGVLEVMHNDQRRLLHLRFACAGAAEPLTPRAKRQRPAICWRRNRSQASAFSARVGRGALVSAAFGSSAARRQVVKPPPGAAELPRRLEAGALGDGLDIEPRPHDELARQRDAHAVDVSRHRHAGVLVEQSRQIARTGRRDARGARERPSRAGSAAIASCTRWIAGWM